MLKKISIGIIAGFVSGFFAAGGGMILVPIFVHLLKLEERVARATSVFCILFMVITSGIFYVRSDLIEWSLAIKCAIGGVVGGFIGVKLLNKAPVIFLKITFILFLLFLSIRMVFT